MALPSDSLYARGFASDARTLRALREALAGHKVRVQRGQFPRSHQDVGGRARARLLFVDLDGVADPEMAARELATVCAAETAVIAIGSTDTAQFARTLLQGGIADYLLKPVSALQIREAHAAVFADPTERAYAGCVVAFAGSAGSGTSTLVAAIARAIAADGRTASVVDLDPVAARLPGIAGYSPRRRPVSPSRIPQRPRVPLILNRSSHLIRSTTFARRRTTASLWWPSLRSPRRLHRRPPAAVCRLLAHLATGHTWSW